MQCNTFNESLQNCNMFKTVQCKLCKCLSFLYRLRVKYFIYMPFIKKNSITLYTSIVNMIS